jgi:hypothetical protein
LKLFQTKTTARELLNIIKRVKRHACCLRLELEIISNKNNSARAFKYHKVGQASRLLLASSH